MTDLLQYWNTCSHKGKSQNSLRFRPAGSYKTGMLCAGTSTEYFCPMWSTEVDLCLVQNIKFIANRTEHENERHRIVLSLFFLSEESFTRL